MQMTFRAFTSTIAAAALAACSSTTPTSDHSVPDSGAMDMDAESMDDGGGSDAMPVDAATAAGKPMTPQVVAVAKMAGALHVSWKLNDSGLSAVALMRNKDGGSFTKTTLPGSATSQHDTTATAAGTYCFKVVTTRGGIDSDESNQMCGSP